MTCHYFYQILSLLTSAVSTDATVGRMTNMSVVGQVQVL